MPANNPRQPRRSWKDDKPGKAAAGPAQRGWQKEKAPTVGAKGPLLTRRGKIGMAVGGVLLCVVALVVVLFWLRSVPAPVLVLVGAGYQTNLAVPENVAGVHGLDRLEDWAKAYNGDKARDQDKIKIKPRPLAADSDPFDKFTEILENNPKPPLVMVYVAVHGAADREGPYLIPDDANARNNAYTSCRIAKALDALKNKLPRDTKKLLILDTTGIEADATLGLLHNDFVRALLEDKKALAEVPNLVVMLASSENQRSLTSEEWRTTVFAHFVIEGLKGAAAPNGVVTAQSLFDYVEDNVKQWARDNRGVAQVPLLLGDGKIAGDMMLCAVDGNKYVPPAVAESEKFTVPPELLAAWKNREKLEKAQPSPVVYAPHLWRQYLDSLKRYEDLIRADDLASAAAMKDRLTKLETQIKAAQRDEREVLAASALPAALGGSLTDAELARTQQDFDRLWADKLPAEEFARTMREWQDKVNGPFDRQVLRLRMGQLLLRQASRSEADFTRACAVLPSVDDVEAPRRPAEAHFALMLNRHLPAEGRNADQLKKALEVRLQAEEAALGIGVASPLPAYSDQVLPWIKAEVERADVNRRAGEDLSFASSYKAADAAAATAKARADYGELQAKALIIRQALAARDHALAELPYYTVWQSTLPALGEDEEAKTIALWDRVHGLAALLDKPNFDKIDDLTKPTKEVADGLRALAQGFKTTLPAEEAKTQPRWHDIDNRLRVPFIDADRRMELLTQLRNTSQWLSAQPPSGNKAPDVGGEKAAAQRRGKLARAVLGKHHPVTKDAETAITRPDEGAWGRSLAGAGELIGGAYQQMALDVYDKKTARGREAPLPEAHVLLRSAALEARQLPGAASAAWPQVDPVGENRRVDLHDLLAFQAQRAFDDYWTSDEPKKQPQPYYRDAGLVYLTAARALAADANLPTGAKTARLTEFERLTALLGQDDALTPRWYDGPDPKAVTFPLNITDEDRVTRRFRLDKAAAAPAGIPVVWTEPGPGLKAAKPEDLEHRALIPDKAASADGSLEYDLLPVRTGNERRARETSSYAFAGFFRGRVARLPMPVALFHRPEVTSYLPDFPKTARLAIKTSEDDLARFAAAYSELVIVLDYSGSMKSITKETKGKQEKSRKEEALAALRKCMAKVPKGVRVTLLTFGEVGWGHQINAQWDKIEWDPASEKVERRFSQLEALKPDGYTPLVRATARAKNYFSPGFTGAKSLLVVTDGGDSEFFSNSDEGKAMRREAATMEKYLHQQFDGTGILVNVLGIETEYLDPKEDAEEIKGLEKYKPAIESIGGKFVPVKDSETLAREIERFLMQIRYRVDGEEGRESGHVPPGAVPEDGANVSRTRDNYRWVRGLGPGTFMVAMQTNRLQKKAIEQRVRLEGGDAMVLQLVPMLDNSKQFMLRRELFAESYAVAGLNKVLAQKDIDKTWLVSVLQNQLLDPTRRENLQMMATIEKRDSPAATSKTSLQVMRPPFVWFNVAAADGPKAAPSGLRFYPLADYPAAAYSIDLPEWSGTKESALDLWWTDDAPPDCGILRPENGTRLTALKQHGLDVRPTPQADAVRLVVESIAFERRTVEVKPKEKPKENVDCLVVRLRWDPSKSGPFFALLPEDVTASGAEHRFYLEAGKYTGVFFNVSDDKVKALTGLTLHSVDAVKLKAHAVPGLRVGTPNTESRPDKPHDPETPND